MDVLNQSIIFSAYPQFEDKLVQRVTEISNRIHQFCMEEAKDWGEEIEQTGAIPKALWKRLRELGFHKLTAPTKYGGEELPLSLFFPLLERIAHCHGSIRKIFHTYNSIWRIIAQGSEQQRAFWLTKLVEEGALITFASAEPNNAIGSDFHITTTHRNGKHLLNGRKNLVPFAEESSVIAVIAEMDGGTEHKSFTAFLVPQGKPGMRLDPMSHMMGDKGCSHAVITFDNCELGDDEVLGQVSQGYGVAINNFLDQNRACIAQSSIGLAQEALDVTLAYARKRTTYGRPIGSRQEIQTKLGEMQIAVHTARLLGMEIAQKFDLGQDISLESSIAKGNAVRMVSEVTDAALALHGGTGYCEGSPVERLYRDARSLWFEDGTAESQKVFIAETLLKHLSN